MNEKRRIIALIIILAISITVIASVTIFLLYRAAFEGQKARLAETARSRARMMEAVARFDMRYSDQDIAGGAFAATLLQVFDAHSRFKGFGETGEFALAKRDGDEIVFLLSRRHRGSEDAGIEIPLSRPIPFNSDIAKPMRRALSGESGIIIGLDYRGVRVLAAYEPVDVLNLGIVAKIDLAEIRAPFIRAGLLATAIGLLIIIIGTLLFLRISDPMIQRLGESEERLRYALEGAGDGVWDWNIKTDDMFYSERWASMLGYKLDEIEPTFDFLNGLVHPDDNSSFKKAINDHLENKTPFFGVGLRMKAKSGMWKWILSRGRIMERDARGKPLRMIGTHQDITERKMTEDALCLQSEIAMNMSEGVYLVRVSDGIIVYTNPKFEKMFGYAPGEMIGKHFSIVSYPTEESQDETVIQIIKFKEERGAWVGESLNIKKDGTPFWNYASISMFDHPDYGKVMVAVHTDITARKQAEAERMELVAELEKKQAEMERFNYTISHELKSPIITIRGFIGLLERDIDAKDMKRVRADAARIAEAAGSQQQMIEELLKLSRAGLVIGEEKEVSLGDIARQAIELVTAQIKKHRIKVEISPDLPVVRGDPVRLREVFQNLVENAAKFMGDQPAPHIEIGVRNDTSEPVFYVRDNGMGIETEYHSRIFDIFEQLDQEFDGSGVGLALVKRIVEKHGGRIWAESEGAGKGASFCFTLPGVLPQVTKMNGSKREEICR